MSKHHLHPIIYARGGTELNRKIVDEIKQEIKKGEGTKQIHVLVLGGNNIRRGTNVWSVQGVASFFKELTVFASEVKDVALIFSGMLPSPGFEATSSRPFEALNTELFNICIQSGGVSTYFDAASFLTSPEGHILPHLYKADGIHLSECSTYNIARGLKELVLKLII